jgi:TetR/AcrR family transcriptional repressor of multidrug resistance operon
MRPKDLDKEAAIRNIALQIISEEGLENLSMQKLAKAANVSPRTIYIKYENKEDLLIKLFIDEVLGNYEAAMLDGFSDTMDFRTWMRKLWLNVFHYFRQHQPAFRLMQYGKSSPLLNKAFQQRNIKEGQYFAPIHRFFEAQVAAGIIKYYPHEIHLALLFSPVVELVNEYFDYQERPQQIISENVILECCDSVIKSILL